MITIGYVTLLCLAISCLADGFPDFSFQWLDEFRHIQDTLIQASTVNESNTRLIRRGSGTKGPSSSSSGQRAPPIKSSQQPNLSPSRSAGNLKDFVQTPENPANTLSFQAPQRAGEKSPKKDIKSQIAAVKPNTKKYIQDLGQVQEKIQTWRALAGSGLRGHSMSAHGTLEKVEKSVSLLSKPSQKTVNSQSAGPSGLNGKTVDHANRLALNSGATSSTSSAHQKHTQDVSIYTSKLSLQDQARMIEHNEWLAETKESIGKAERAWKRTSKGNRQSARSYTATTDPATAKAIQSKINSKRARVSAKEAIAKADELLHSEPASSPKAWECLSSTSHEVRTACAIGAVHAKVERKAAEIAKDARRWDLVASHSKASAKAMTRARALEEQNYSFLAQYRAKAAEERAQALPKDHPNRRKAEETAEFEQKDYERSALFYHSVHDQYHQTRKVFPGSDSEDEERIFPGISYPTSQS